MRPDVNEMSVVKQQQQQQQRCRRDRMPELVARAHGTQRPGDDLSLYNFTWVCAVLPTSYILPMQFVRFVCYARKMPSLSH